MKVEKKEYTVREYKFTVDAEELGVLLAGVRSRIVLAKIDKQPYKEDLARNMEQDILKALADRDN